MADLERLDRIMERILDKLAEMPHWAREAYERGVKEAEREINESDNRHS